MCAQYQWTVTPKGGIERVIALLSLKPVACVYVVTYTWLLVISPCLFSHLAQTMIGTHNEANQVKRKWLRENMNVVLSDTEKSNILNLSAIVKPSMRCSLMKFLSGWNKRRYKGPERWSDDNFALHHPTHPDHLHGDWPFHITLMLVGLAF